MFKIEKGIPLPDDDLNNGRLIYPLEMLKRGDSFIVPFNGKRAASEKRKVSRRLGVAIYKFKKRNQGWNFTYRTLKEGVRCWRIA